MDRRQFFASFAVALSVPVMRRKTRKQYWPTEMLCGDRWVFVDETVTRGLGVDPELRWLMMEETVTREEFALRCPEGPSKSIAHSGCREA